MKKRIFSRILALVMAVSLLSTTALAVEYDIGLGMVTIDSTGSKGVVVGGTEESYTPFTENDYNVTITGNSEKNFVTVGENVQDVTVTLRDVNISLPESRYWGASPRAAALSVGAGSDVTVELDGKNTLISSAGYAGLQLDKGGSVTIQDKNGTAGSLTAVGKAGGAGIGSRSRGTAGNITIDHAKVEAKSSLTSMDMKQGGAAIGSGGNGAVGSITIRDSNDLKADVGYYNNAAAIGSGYKGTVGGDIRIERSDNLQAGGYAYDGVSTGIGAATCGTVQGGIFIEDCDNLRATGSNGGAGIGSSESDTNLSEAGRVEGGISIKNSDCLTATGMGGNGIMGGAGIGTGVGGTVAGGISIENCDNLTAQGTSYNGAAGIGTAWKGTLTGDITIKDSDNLKASSESHTGIGADYGSTITGSINIENCKSLHAEGGRTGIGTSDSNNTITGKISIKGCDKLVAIGGSSAGIGAGNGDALGSWATPGKIAGGIEIILGENDTLTAISKRNGVGIGCIGDHHVGGITIQGGNIIARGGYNQWANDEDGIRPGIGCTNGETITLKDLTSLLALGGSKKTVDGVYGVQDGGGISPSLTQADGRGILNIQFDSSLIDSKKYWKDQNVYVQIFDAQGNKVGEPIPMYNPETDYAGALNQLALLVDPGTYYVCVATGSGDDASIKLARLSGDSQLNIARTVEAQKITSEMLSAFDGKNSTVYEFQFEGDATHPSVEVPASSIEDLTQKFFQDNTGELSGYEDVVLADGTGSWHFDGWSRELGPISDNRDQVVFTAKVTGKWTFVPNEDDPTDPTDPADPGIEIGDPEIPLTAGAGTGTTIEDDEVPLSGLFTRADAIGYLWEQTGSPEAELSDFPDVPEDHYWAVAIGWAQDMGIALPDEEGNFRPDDLVLPTSDEPEGELQEFLNRYAVFAGIELEDGELFFEVSDEDGIIMGEEAQVIFDEFFAKLEAALAKAA